jgi:sugar phosphate isomerase/epimerase
MRFGISTHVFHAERLARRHLEALAGHGFDLVEVFATRTHFGYHDDRQVGELKAWLDDLGLQAASMHLPITAGVPGGVWGTPYSNASTDGAVRQQALDETRLALDAAARLGCRTGVLHLGLPRGMPMPAPDNDARAARSSVEALAAAAASAGLQLAIEVIPNDLSAPDVLRELLAGDLELGATGVCLDVGHAHLMGGAPEAIELLAGHIVTTHVHDNRGAADDHLVPFAGTIDWTATLLTLSKVGYPGPLLFEVAGDDDAAGVLRRTVGARTRLQAILDDLSAPLAFDESDSDGAAALPRWSRGSSDPRNPG